MLFIFIIDSWHICCSLQLMEFWLTTLRYFVEIFGCARHISAPLLGCLVCMFIFDDFITTIIFPADLFVWEFNALNLLHWFK